MRQFLLFMLMLFGPGTLVSYADDIHDAAKTGDIAAITAALDAGADINAEDGGGTPLYFASRRGHLAAVRFLVERGANVNSNTYLGQPLRGAVERDRAEIITLLLARGADPNSSSDNKTVLHIAAERGCLGCVKALVEAGADVNAQQKWNDEGSVYLWIKTPLHLAMRSEHYDVADYLKAHGVIIPRPAPISARLASAMRPPIGLEEKLPGPYGLK